MDSVENEEQVGELEISKLSRNVKEDHLKEICSTYGTVKDVQIRRDPKTNISKGTASVIFLKESSAEQAMCYLDGCQIDGGVVKVSYVLVSSKKNRDSSVGRDDNRNSRVVRDSKDTCQSPRGRERSPVQNNYRNKPTDSALYGSRGRSPPRRPVATSGRYVPKERDGRRGSSRDRNYRSRSRDRPGAGRVNNNAGRRRSPPPSGPARRDSRALSDNKGRDRRRSWSRSRTRSRSPPRRDAGGRGRRSYSRSSRSSSRSTRSSSYTSSSTSDEETRRNRRRRRSSSNSSSNSRSSSRSSYTRSSGSRSLSRSRSVDRNRKKMSVLSAGSSKDIDYLDEDPTLLSNGGLPMFASGHHKEGRLKVVPQDVTYATFATMGPAEIYDKMCSLVHFGHISNRILRKMIHAGFLDASCGNTLGKNRKTKSEQRKLFDSLTTQGVLFLHKIIKSELEGVDIKDDVSITADKIVGNKRPIHEGSSSVPSYFPNKQPSSESRRSEQITKSELIEAIQEAFHSSKAMELTMASIAKENAERKQNAIKFLQDQLKEGNKLTAAKKKEFEVKLEELLSTICMEL